MRHFTIEQRRVGELEISDEDWDQAKKEGLSFLNLCWELYESIDWFDEDLEVTEGPEDEYYS